jgi:phenylalanyl-tRNA synthetase beta chain
MKLSEQWLREWVSPSLNGKQLCSKLTMCGLEVESYSPVSEKFSNVIVAQVVLVEKHPNADRLHVCRVDIGKSELLTIVCGATNVRPGLKVAASLEGAVLPNKMMITNSKIRGVSSQGMLCSAKELCLAEESQGVIELPQDAPLGQEVWDYLKLADHVIDVSITPNRGDCLSILGLAKEIAAETQSQLTMPSFPSVKANINDTFPVIVDAAVECPRYVARIIRKVKADATTPIKMQEYLRRSGIRCINPIVDVMNYVMLELGQPMHAFDLKMLTGEIYVRMAKAKEKIKLLDSSTIELKSDTLVIADQEKPQALAGIMGGIESAVTLLTEDIFLESAYFNPTTITQAVRQYGLNSESSYRFERSVDSTLQNLAIERATQLLLEIVGGQAGPVMEVINEKNLPQIDTILLRSARIEKILGLKIPDQDIESLLQRLEFNCKKISDGWQVVIPLRRPDITKEIDLIEEVMRLYGYENLPQHTPYAVLQVTPRREDQIPLSLFKRIFCDLGYHEVITYSFIDKKSQSLFDPNAVYKELANPITAEMTVMRTSLWPGLVNTLLYNKNRQQTRIRLFEAGLKFIEHNNELFQQKVISGLISGSAFPEQWGVSTREVDFFDMKGDLEAIFKQTYVENEFIFKPGFHPVLHPGQTAEIYRERNYIGICGALHPHIVQKLDIYKSFVFELLYEPLEIACIPAFTEVSKFPEIRRDIAILVDQSVSSELIRNAISETARELLKDINVFDVYQGKGISPDRKSIALTLILQHSSRTLVDQEVVDLMERVTDTLKQKFAAELRG